jgi:hypothetical protein
MFFDDILQITSLVLDSQVCDTLLVVQQSALNSWF